MATVVGQASAAATSVAIPAHVAGDLIIVSARGTAAAPVKPAASGTVPAWDTLQSALANAVGLTVVSFVATGSTTTTGTFTSATHICVLVLRPAAVKKLQTSAARSAVGNGNNTQTIIYPALVLNNGGGASTSLGVRVGTRTVADSEIGTAIPAGWTNQSIQPAGASALMAVHTRLALAANPTADSVSTAGTNAAYRAVTVEVEEVPLGETELFVGSAVGTATVAVGMTVLPPPISFAIDLATNQPYAGEHEAGEFLAGVEPLLELDLQIVGFTVIDGLVAGQAQVGASLSVAHDLSVAISRQGTVTAQQELIRGFAASIDRAAAIAAQQGVVRNLSTAPISGQGVVAADISRVPLSVTLAASVAGAAVVSPSLTVANASFVSFDASVQGQAQVTAQAVKTVNLPAQIARQATVATGIQTSAAISLQALVVGKGEISAETVRTRALATPVVGAAAVATSVNIGHTITFSAGIVGSSVVSTTVTPIRMVALECNIRTIIPLCGEHLCGVFTGGGPFICGGFSGPHSVITIGVVRIVNWAVPVEGKAELVTLLRPSTAMGVLVEGQANIQVNLVRSGLAFSVEVGGQAQVDPRMTLLINMPSQIVGKAEIKVKINLDWLAPTDPADILLPPTTEGSWILVPTAPTNSVLVPTAGAVEVLTPTDEEDWILIPTTERTM